MTSGGSTKQPPKAHRGRFQAQGNGVEKSVPWGQDSAPTTAQGHTWLDVLWEMLPAREQRDREGDFAEAHDFVDESAKRGGLPSDSQYPVAKSFPRRPAKGGRRVDVEIHAGKAFV